MGSEGRRRTVASVSVRAAVPGGGGGMPMWVGERDGMGGEKDGEEEEEEEEEWGGAAAERHLVGQMDGWRATPGSRDLGRKSYC